MGIAPEELLTLPTHLRGEAPAYPRRGDLFSALRLRQDAASGREKRRRRRATESRHSEEVLAGMLTRTGRDATNSQAGQQRASASSCTIALLRAGCPRPAVQHLHRSGEVGLGRAMGLAGGDSSDIDSGISEWGSGDDGDTATFEEFLDKEARNTRRNNRGSSPVSSSSTCRSLDDSRRPSRAASKPRPAQKEKVTEGLPAPQALPAEVSPEATIVSVNTKSQTKTCQTTFEERSLPTSRQNAPAPQAPRQLSQVIEKCQQRIVTAVPRVRCTETRSEGVQCDGPPVDQGVQTSALRLPRKRTIVRDRIVHAKSPLPTEGSFSPGAVADRDRREACVDTTTMEIAVESRQPGSNETISVEEAGAGVSRMHIRVGLEGLQDSDRGQQLTVWAMARGDDPSAAGPVILLPLQGGDNEGRGVRRYLSVTDSEDGRGDLRGTAVTRPALLQPERGTGSQAHASGGRENGMRPPNRRNIVEEEDKAVYGESGDGHEEEAEERWRTSRLDPLWERLGPLGERMALVDERFDRLDLEMSHDRGVIENYQREAREEADMAEKDIVKIQAHRRRHPARSLASAPQVPLWRSRTDTTNNLVALDSNTLQIETESLPAITHTPLYGYGRESYGNGEGDKKLDPGDATLQAEEELREARVILKHIEQELRLDTTDTKGASPSPLEAMADLVGPIAVAATRVSELREEARDLTTALGPTLSTARPGLPAGCRKNNESNQTNRPKNHLTPASKFGERYHRVAERSSGRASNKPNSRADSTGLVRGADGVCSRSEGVLVVQGPPWS